MNTIRVQLRHKDAVIPTKAHPTDAGWDITAIKLAKVYDNGVRLYDTGLAISPPPGYYTEIVPRSSISKTNWTLANTIGIIDTNYRGNLYIAMRHVGYTGSMDNLTLPFKLCQLVLRKCELGQFMEVESFGESTDRGGGGFGSTDV